MRYWAARGQRVRGKLSGTEEKPQKVLCSPPKWNGSLHFGPHGVLGNNEKDVTGKTELKNQHKSG